MAIAGHVSRKMLEDYSHIRMEAKRRALDALSTRLGRVTSHSTSQNPVSEGVPGSEVIEKAGGDDGARTRDLMRDRHAF
jgi:hypothetical protein